MPEKELLDRLCDIRDECSDEHTRIQIQNLISARWGGSNDNSTGSVNR